MRLPVQILKFLAIEDAENRDAEGVEGEKPTKGYGERRKLPQRGPGRIPGRKRVLEYLELEKNTPDSLSGVFFIYFVCI